MSYTLGQKVRLRGCITRLIDIFNKEPSYLEDLVGYHHGRLNKGYYLLLLTEPFAAGDFEFFGYTYMSGGKLGLPSNDKVSEAMRPSVHNRLLSQYGQQGREQIIKDFCKDVPLRLKGELRYAKILSVARDDSSMGAADQYPSSQSGIAQPISLLAGHEKEFLVAAEVHGTTWAFPPNVKFLAPYDNPPVTINLRVGPRYDRPYGEDPRKQVIDYLSRA